MTNPLPVFISSGHDRYALHRGRQREPSVRRLRPLPDFRSYWAFVLRRFWADLRIRALTG